jgi:proteic killer suppression protein
MIRRFRCKDTQAVFEGGDPRRLRAIETVATRKLAMLDAAKTPDFMRSPPGNRLEALRVDRAVSLELWLAGHGPLCPIDSRTTTSCV